MRRGLIVWDAEEITSSALDARLERLRTAMAGQGLDAIILYTNFVRPAAVAYMSSFSPYWADAILFIPLSGEPIFSTSMSTRMNRWIKTVNPVGDIVNTRRPGVHVGEWLKKNTHVSAIGVVEIDGLPAGIYNDLVATAPDVELVDATALFSEFRGHVDATEHALLSYCNALAERGLAAVDPEGMTDAGAAVGRVEQVARLGGAEEAYVALAPDTGADLRLARVSGAVPLGRTFAIRASVAYKGAWLRRTRSFSADAAMSARIADIDHWFSGLLADLDTTRGIGPQIADAAAARGGSDITLLVESCSGTYPLQPVADPAQPPREGALYVISLAMRVDGLGWVGAAPLIQGNPLVDQALVKGRS
ncbi:aminopeptidase P family N-terminal domain-containing protein [Mesorhizobium sp. CAU 1741]|uniref:aminopeptidase P family N-terminal domain-containing protein n=1 Tax=Mesorhizobium sp. CAU 1741 TaxID=3140366 RepID=UPI00325B9DE9